MSKYTVFRSKFWKMVEKTDKIVVTGHVGPDDDSVASVLAVYWLVLEKFPKKEVRMICSGETTDEWGYFEGFEGIEFVEEITERLQAPAKGGQAAESSEPSFATLRTAEGSELPFAEDKPLVIMLDGGSFDRFSKKPNELRELAGKTVCIDHHNSTPDMFDLAYISPTFSSTAEGVYRLLIEKSKKVPKRLAEIFLLGILGDTGNFAYLNKDTAKVLDIVQKMIGEGKVSIQELQSKYQQYPKNILMIIGDMISNTKYFIKIGKWPAFQVGLITREFVEEHGFDDGEISTASHIYTAQYLRSVRGYNWGFTITPREDETCSLSFRSLPDVVNVRKLAKKFNGGGHDLASGGEIKLKNPEDCLRMILNTLRLPK